VTATPADLLIDGFGRVKDSVHGAIDGLDPDRLADRIDRGANSIAWLVWHLTRIQDDHVADLAGTEQRWQAGGWAPRFALPFAPAATGYGHSSSDVAALRGVASDLLGGYHDDVHEATIGYLRGLDAAELDRVVDTSWDPPVTVAVRLVSVLSDDLEHVGQAAFVRGSLERR
jgi:Protein of unknown function (DUF664)